MQDCEIWPHETGNITQEVFWYGVLFRHDIWVTDKWTDGQTRSQQMPPGTLSAVPYLSIFLQASSQALCMPNFSVEILEETFVNCNLSATVNTSCNGNHSNTTLKCKRLKQVGTWCTVLSSVYSGTRLQIFIDIGSYLIYKEQINQMVYSV